MLSNTVIVALALVFLSVLPGVARLSQPISTPGASACVPSTPNHMAPPAALRHYANPATTYAMDGLWASIPPDGRVILSKDDIVTVSNDGGVFMHWRATKLPWTRGDGVVGPLIVTGRRLDAAAPPAVDIGFERQYGSMGFTPVSLAFPSPGCWQITGTVGDHVNTFILEVLFVDTPSRAATPDT